MRTAGWRASECRTGSWRLRPAEPRADSRSCGVARRGCKGQHGEAWSAAGEELTPAGRRVIQDVETGRDGEHDRPGEQCIGGASAASGAGGAGAAVLPALRRFRVALEPLQIPFSSAALW